MGRSKPKVPAGHGHNADPLSDEEASALVLHHELKINEAQREVDKLATDLASARKVVNGYFKRMTADLQFTRREFESEVIVKSRMSEGEYLAAERKRARLHRLSGRAGEQLDLINDVLPDTADDAALCYANGFRVGHLAGDPTPPKETAPAFHQDWMRGYHDAQEENGKKLAMAAEVIARREKPAVGMTADDDGEEGGEGEPDLAPDTITAKARKLKKEGWTEPTEAEREFEPA